MAKFPLHPERRPAVVTGASSGIGAATAIALAERGHPVAIGARRLERCQETAAAVLAAGGEAVALALDVGDPASIKEFIAGAEEAHGPVEVLVSNAGDTALGDGVDTPPADFAAQVQVNLLAAQQLVSLVAPGMVERARGDLVFVTSDAVTQPRPGIAGYLTAKYGLEGFATVLRTELEGTGVRASIVRPGPTMTEMGREWDAAAFAALIDRWAQWGVARHDNFLRPIDVAAAVVAVVSTPRGAHVTLIEVEPEGPLPQDPSWQGGPP